METKIVLTAIGPDQPGIVDRLTGHLADLGFNIQDSRMAVLGGEFAGILLISGKVPEGKQVSDLAHDLEPICGMTLLARETAGTAPSPASIPFVVHGYAIDHPGIVHGLAHEIAALGANILEMETATTHAPVTGTPLFEVEMRISLPASVSITELRKKLADLSERRNIDILVEPFS